jgi:hypothetical protein
MTDRTRRKQLVSEYKQTRPQPGVFRIVNQVTGRMLIGATPNLDSIHAKMRFARITHSGSALDMRLRKDVAEYGIDAFVVEVIEELDIAPEMTDAQIRDELRVLEALYREQADPATLY